MIITTGGQQGLDLVPKVLCNEGDTVIVESPTFVSGINAFKSYGVNLVGIEMDDEGIRLDLLEENIKVQQCQISILDSHISKSKRQNYESETSPRRYKLCLKYGILILEDNPYGELRFRGDDIPTLKSMDEEGIVIYNGSYSKVISAGMRIGFLCAHKDLLQHMSTGKQVADCHTNIFFQMVTEQFLNNYDFDAHIKKICGIYKEKCDFMLSLLDQYMDKRVTYTRPDGGLFLWCTLPKNYDSMEFARLCLKKALLLFQAVLLW